jgi:hypothetical protein
MSFTCDLVAELAESDYMRCRRIANCEDCVLVFSVEQGTFEVAVLDALTSEVINELRIEPNVVCCMYIVAWRRLRERTFVF